MASQLGLPDHAISAIGYDGPGVGKLRYRGDDFSEFAFAQPEVDGLIGNGKPRQRGSGSGCGAGEVPATRWSDPEQHAGEQVP